MPWLQSRGSIVLGLLLMGSSACDLRDPGDDGAGEDTGETGDEPEQAQGVRPAALRWVLDWEVVDGFEVTNDLGYLVRVDAGWIGSWGATLVECSSAKAPTREPDSPDGELGVASPWLVAEGHASGEDDASAWVFAGVESLTGAEVVSSEVIELGTTRYCSAHYLLAPISDASQGFADAEAELALRDPDASLTGATVVIFGSAEPPGGGEPVPFVLRSEQAYGKIIELEFELTDATLVDAAIDVVIRRELAGAFEQIDFATIAADPDAASWQLLGNLAKHTRTLARATE